MQLTLIMILHILVAFALISLVLMQRGKGAQMGAAFGAGASGTMFGSQGATPFMVKLIAGLAVLFFCTSLGLNYAVSKANSVRQPDILDSSPGTVQPAPVNQGIDQQQAPANS
jgi:preprotein translocase subunit SecG